MSDRAQETPRPAARTPRLAPEVLDERAGANSLELDWRVPAQLDCWPGHFPGQPVLPGVLQIEWLMQAIRAWTGRPPQLARIEGLKFKQLVRPGERLTLRLERDADGAVFRFRLGSGGTPVSSGRVVLGAAPGGEA